MKAGSLRFIANSVAPAMALLFAVLIPAPCPAQVTPTGWEMIGPYSGQWGYTLRDPNDLDVLYMFAGSEGVFKSEDNGRTWQWMHNGLVTKDIDSFSGFAFCASDPDVMYLGVRSDIVCSDIYEGLYKSEDGGESWNKIWQDQGLGQVVGPFAVSRTNPDIVLAKIEPDAYSTYIARSIDGGFTWKLVTEVPGGSMGRIVFHPSDPDLVIVNVGVAWGYSLDSGATWTFVPVNTEPAVYVTDLRVDPYNPCHIVISGYCSDKEYRGVYETTDCGQSWRFLGKTFWTSFLGVNFDCSPIRIFTAENRSLDGGVTWEEYGSSCGEFVTELNGILFDPRDPDWVVMNYCYGLLRAAPGGLDWYQQAFIGGYAADNISVNPGNPDHIVINCGLAKIHKTVDGGKTWYGASRNLFLVDCKKLIRDPKRPEILYAVGNRQMYKSEDEGESWQMMLPLGCGEIVIDPFNSDNLYAAVGYQIDDDLNYAVIKSTDAGKSWFPVLDENVDHIACSPFYPGLVFCVNHLWGGDTPKLFVSGDGGGTWTGFTPELKPGDMRYEYICELAFDRFDPDTVYITVMDYDGHLGFRKSTDLGLTFSNPSKDAVFRPCDYIYFDLDENNPDTIYMSRSHNFYRSMDGGSRWSKLGEISGVFTVLSGDTTTIYANQMRTDLGWSVPTLYRKRIRDTRPRILKAGYGATRIMGSSGGKLRILCDVEIPESAWDPIEVEVYYSGLPTDIFLNDAGVDGDAVAEDNRYSVELDFPSGTAPYVVPLELVVRDAKGRVSDTWPKCTSHKRKEAP